MMDKIYDSFFISGEKFTIEDYNENSYALYHEEMFVAELKSTDRKDAMPLAVKYMTRHHAA